MTYKIEFSHYLSEITDIKEIEGLKQDTLLHPKFFTARRQECTDILQAEKLKDQKFDFVKPLNFQII